MMMMMICLLSAFSILNSAVFLHELALLSLVLTDSDISDFIHNLESQNIKVEMMTHSDYMSAAPHSAAINVTGSNKVS